MTALPARRGIAVMELVVVALIVIVLLAIALPRFTRPTLDIVSGPARSVPTGAAGPLAVRVTSWRGEALAGIAVVFEPDAGIAVTPSVVRTDSSGVASTTWFAGPTAGERTIVAHVEGRRSPNVRIAVRATPAAPPMPTGPTGDSGGAALPAAGDTTRTGATTPGTTPPASGRPAPTPAAATPPRADSGAPRR